jgi:hypothetical protein
MSRPVRRYKQPQSQGAQKITPRRARGGPVRFRQPEQPAQRFKKQGRTTYRQPDHALAAAASAGQSIASASWDGPEAHLRDALRAAVAREQMTAPLIAVLVPVLGRPHRVQQLVDSFRSATSPSDAALYFVAQHSDVHEVAAIRAAGLEPILVGDEDRSWAKKINRGFERTRESWLLLAADDLRFHAGWVDNARKLLRVHEGVIGTNDLGNPSTMHGVSSTHPLVRRRYAEVCGTVDERGRVLHEGYDHNFADTELVSTAKRRGLYVHCYRCHVEHLHPAWGKGEWDAVYTRGQEQYHRDGALFAARGRQHGWA